MQQIEYSQLFIAPSPIHGTGLFTKTFIPKGTIILEYVGNRVGNLMADKLEKKYIENDIKSIYFFKVADDDIIDATVFGNKSRFINHSCMPNSRSILKNNRIFIMAIQDINVNEEITIYYNFSNSEERLRCRCNSEYCRKFL
ncbi:Histone-lysine N-methyltransferase 2A [Dictyocoela muelleri]|nr:Histone-lysine N-methyltransferase 2A [Dictyocoela muelleri]